MTDAIKIVVSQKVYKQRPTRLCRTGLIQSVMEVVVAKEKAGRADDLAVPPRA